MTQTAEQPPSPQALERGYEPPDVNNRGLVVFFIIFAAVAVIINVGLWGLFKFYIAERRPVDAAMSAAPAQQRFPAPNLQPIERHNELPWEDLQDLQNEKNEIFKQLGWQVNQDNSIPAIPDSIVSELAKQRNSNGGGK